MQRFLLAKSATEAGNMLKPSVSGRKWIRPALSKRKAAMIRKEALRNGTYGTWTPVEGGWLPEWDGVAKHTVPNPPKLHKNIRTLDDR